MQGKLDVHAHLPEGLVDKVDSYVVRGYYSSRTEFIADSLRRRLEELGGGQESEERPSPVELGKKKEKGAEHPQNSSRPPSANSNHSGDCQ